MDEIGELLRQNSTIGYSNRINIIDKLVADRWCSMDRLSFAYAAMRDSDRPVIMALFELPYRVLLPERKWLHVPAEYGNPYICFAPIAASTSNGIGSDQKPNVRTQALVSFQLWGRRREFYEDYLAAVASYSMFNVHFVPSQASWLSNLSPLTPATYEAELTTRIYRETREVIKVFLKTYKVAARDPKAYLPVRFDSFFVMTKHGRVVVVKGAERPTEPPGLVESQADHSGNFKRLTQMMRSGRQPSIYEQYLLEAAKQAENGLANLAIVYTVMILDWFANELIHDGIVRPVERTLKHAGPVASLVRERLWESDSPNSRFRTPVRTPEKFEKYLPTMGLELPADLKAQLLDVIKIRNRVIHKTQTAVIERHVADHAVSVGMRVIEFCMCKRIEIVNKKPAESTDGRNHS
jgi:hypothetical protein